MLCGCLPQQRFGTWGRLGQEEPAPREGGNGERFLGPPGDAWVRGPVGFILPFVLSNKERKLCAHPRLEIYQQDQIYFMCPLARQGDFYVPEVKETERKSRGPAEANDALVDGTGTGSGMRVGPHLEPPPGRVGLVKEPPPWLCGTVSVQTSAWQRWKKGPTSPHAELPVPIHRDPWRRGFTQVTLAMQIEILPRIPFTFRCSRRTLGSSDHRQLDAHSGVGGISEAAQERHCLGQAH